MSGSVNMGLWNANPPVITVTSSTTSVIEKCVVTQVTATKYQSLLVYDVIIISIINSKCLCMERQMRKPYKPESLIYEHRIPPPPIKLL